MISIAIVDTGPLVASANRADPDHGACLDALQSRDYALVLPALCIAEATYLIGKKQGPRIESLFLQSLQSFDIQAPIAAEWQRIAELVEEYKDFRSGERMRRWPRWPRGSKRTCSSRGTGSVFRWCARGAIGRFVYFP